MRTRTTRTRRLLAAATLAALPLVVGALQSGRGPTTDDADTARARSITERPDGPRWHFVTGSGEALSIGPCGEWGSCLLLAF